MNILKVPGVFNIKNRTMRFMLYALFGIVVADGLITEFLVAHGHGVEVNPFLKAWVAQDMFLAIKVSAAFLVTLLLWVKYNARPRLIYAITAAFLVFYTGVVFWNLIVFLTA